MTAYRDRLHAGHYEDKPKAVKVTSTKYDPGTSALEAIDAAAAEEFPRTQPVEVSRPKRTRKAKPSK